MENPYREDYTIVIEPTLNTENPIENPVKVNYKNAASIEEGSLILVYGDVYDIHPQRLRHKSFAKVNGKYVIILKDRKEMINSY